ncbi:conserved hypothetical protein [Caldicellulosiruptor hydrothermalis 108]|uniref:Uncharacterized protein n=1 Tax=Caldicellulosiruptor hydrothermalis (strain DSM 18901 / VKM B-2411 / 108) TaxID=632292 RepID=E4QD61_CALH1|nr:DUF2802 domain-containing protein [Caldicellulosiruptor hydrothermalis]ADQ06356.1 conserved hypothetical protein [Caldicellulosiruptor hydrothermalis 108]
MDAYVILFIFFGLILILWSLRSIKKDIERGEKILHESEKAQKTLSQLLNEAIETIEELDSFGEYIIERIENKVRWAKGEILDIEATPVKGNTEHLNTEEKVEKTAETKSYAGKEDYIEPGNDMQKDENKKRSKEELYRKAVELYKQGYTVEQIASSLNIGKGEAKLAIRIVGRESS